MQRKKFLALLLTVWACASSWGQQRVYEMSSFGIEPDRGVNMSAKFQAALEKIHREAGGAGQTVLRFAKGTYHFYPEGAARREYYVSNHDQDNPKIVGMPLEGFQDLVLEGNGASFLFHGIMLPLSLVNSSGCVLKDFSIDFVNPQIAQVQVVKNEGEKGLTFKVAPWVKYRVSADSVFETYGEGWAERPECGIAFEETTKHVVYRTSDLVFSTKGIREVEPSVLHAPQWKDAEKKLRPGTVIAMRTWKRPAPGIFLSHDTGVTLDHVTVHYAYGMGLLAQLCDTVSLNCFSVCLKGGDDPRYFTTQADATHFSGCKGTITSVGGLYEGMMDDAINVHGTYLKVKERIDDRTLLACYMHGQTWGFDWGYPGDEVQFIRARTMELLGGKNKIVSIFPADRPQVNGAKTFKVVFERPVPEEIQPEEGYGMENLTWTPEVRFSGNVVRNNRARGALFSTPRKTVVEDNLFDHTSGTAILLCGDCNGWYETGACRDVLIRRNKFVNALTNMFQFTNAVISIYPEIPDLENQKACFHGGKKGAIRIVDNEFDTFDAPLLYAKSVRGLVFRGNVIRQNTEYKPFHWNRSRFLLEHVTDVEIE